MSTVRPERGVRGEEEEEEEEEEDMASCTEDSACATSGVCTDSSCPNMNSMYKVVKTVTSTKFRQDPFEDYYEVYEEIGR